ncbi:uncharacterized protein LOC129588922 [Paramacrobiotus metropolitanus]|uniref:uncharacterized protein LOC129588922 n=1 Tax=Paramacrobiotus metropolitanus TaxID=2943436 RepID=UPI002445CE02|nr:uncharacterized protein LOC129588922 [Paramacrobiotus metropolitanus]
MDVFKSEQMARLSQKISNDFPWKLEVPLLKEVEESQPLKQTEERPPTDVNEPQSAKEITILVLGDGMHSEKALWINGFTLSLMRSSLDEALAKPGIAVPVHFEILDQDLRKHVVSNDSSGADNAAVRPGVVTFQICTVKKSGRIIRILNTPTVSNGGEPGEIRRIAGAILKLLENYVELHGICILLKSRNIVMTPALQELLKALLSRLHRDIVLNIVFVFTDAGSPVNLPVDTVAKLQEWELSGVKLNPEAIYCFDNDVFRCVTAAQTGIQFGAAVTNAMSASWTIGVQESERLLQHVTALPPYNVKATQQLTATRQLLEQLVEMIAAQARTADIAPRFFSGMIQSKIADVERAKRDRNRLRRELYWSAIDWQRVPLPHPRVICVSPRCATSRACHSVCYCLAEASQHGLQCCCMDVEIKRCRRCGCAWDSHRHITSVVRPVEINAVDERVRRVLEIKDQEIAELEDTVTALNQRSDDDSQESDEKFWLLLLAAKIRCFLKIHTALPGKDIMEELLDNLVATKTADVAAGGDQLKLESRERELSNYRRLAEFWDDVRTDGFQLPDGFNEKLYGITMEGIRDDVEQLKVLPLIGLFFDDLRL